MWSIALFKDSNWHTAGVCIEEFNVAIYSNRVTHFSRCIDDPSDLFWLALAETDPSVSEDSPAIIIVREIIKRKIPFKIQYSFTDIADSPVEYFDDNPMEEYTTFINFVVVVDNPSYALICKLLWG